MILNQEKENSKKFPSFGISKNFLFRKLWLFTTKRTLNNNDQRKSLPKCVKDIEDSLKIVAIIKNGSIFFSFYLSSTVLIFL